jgi:hypothetical protein
VFFAFGTLALSFIINFRKSVMKALLFQ